jgi:NADP-reducing hydrogenase subunit HndD
VTPSVRIAVSEEFDKDPGTLKAGQLVAGLKQLGFDLVLDVNTAADLSICGCEEGTELLHRLKAQKNNEDALFMSDPSGPDPLPLFTSCCPGWMNSIEKSSPELKPYVCTCKSKSPHDVWCVQCGAQDV